MGTHTSPSIHKFLYTPVTSSQRRGAPHLPEPDNRSFRGVNGLGGPERNGLGGPERNGSALGLGGPGDLESRLMDGTTSPIDNTSLMRRNETIISLDYVRRGF